MNEIMQKIDDILVEFNKSFTLETNIEKIDQEDVVNGLKIKELKNDGSEFINKLLDVFGPIVESMSDEYELVYDSEHGLAIAKKIVKVEYLFEKK